MKKVISKQAIEKSKEARKVILIEENEMYRIEKIPLNYRIIIKLPIKKEDEFRRLDRDLYCDLDNGLDYTREIVMETIKKYYIKPGEKGWYESIKRREDFKRDVLAKRVLK